MRARGGFEWALLCLWLGGLGCDRGVTAEAPAEPAGGIEAHTGAAEPAKAQADSPLPVEREGLLIGEFHLAGSPVIDGDTIRVEGIAGSIRLLSIDTEEKLHGRADRAAAAKDFERYLKTKRGNGTRPSKAGTPMGEEAARFAREFFDGVDQVRLERDDPKEIRGHFGRLLAYAFVQKNGRWTSYNVECVRAGMSPYFTKYGYSQRFHNPLASAETEARQAQRGIWNPEAQGYGDYDERKAWWNARADFIRAFGHEASRSDDYIQMTHWDALKQLEHKLGQEVTILSTVEKIHHFKGLVRVSLAAPRRDGFPLIFFDRNVFQESGIDRYKQEPIRARGTVERYEKGDYRTLQIVVKKPTQLSFPSLPWPDEAALAAE